MNVREIMVPDPITIDEEQMLSAALRLMEDNSVRHLPVLREGRLVGVLSDRDLLGEVGWLVSRGGEPPLLAQGSVRDFLPGDPITIAPDEDVARAAARMLEEHVGCLPVCRDGALLGLVTEIDLLDAFVGSARYGRLSEGDDPRVGDVMTPEPKCVGPQATLGEVMDVMEAGDLRHVLVVEGGALVGIVSERDLRRAAGPDHARYRVAADIAARDICSARPDEALSRAAARMASEKVGALPVAEARGAPVGILSVRDVLRHGIASRR